MIAGPYRSGARSEAEAAANLRALHRAALEVYRCGHVPVLGVDVALPLIEAAGADAYEEIMLPLSLALAERCDAVLRIGGASAGADAEVERFRARGRPVFESVDALPAADPTGPGALVAAGEEEPKLYSELADWWPVISTPESYAEEAAIFRDVLRSAGAGRSLLELGSGGGHNASHLKADFDMVLVDRAPGMLAASRRLNPECEHVQGDMCSVRLGRSFDAVFVHDAVQYLTSEAALARAMETAFVHLRPGGVALFVPDCVRETFEPRTQSGGHDRGGRSARYLEWTYDPDPADDSAISEFAFVLREGDAASRVVHDRHVFGLFARERWLELLRRAGFEPEIRHASHSEVPNGIEMFLARRPTGAARGYSVAGSNSGSAIRRTTSRLR